MVVLVLAYTLLGGGALLALVRLGRGPSLLDRVVASDVLLVIIAAGLAVHAALMRDPTLVPVLVVVSLLAFVGTVSVARYVGGMLLRSSGDGQDVGLPEAAEVADGGTEGQR
jgi:multicomponent Na+:H+ antiporter subunit F